MRDGVVAVDAEGHQDVGAGVGDAHLQELDHLAGHVARTPLHREAPHDVREHVQQAHGEICKGSSRSGGPWADTPARTCEGQLLDEEVHAGLAGAVQEQGHQHSRVAQHDDGEQDPEEDELLGLQGEHRRRSQTP